MLFFAPALIIVLVVSCGAESASCPGAVLKTTCFGVRTPAEFLASVADPSIYDKTERPPCGNTTHEGPTIVEVQLRLTQLNTVDPKIGTIVVNGYFRTWWHDPRLAYNGTADGGCVDAISIAGKELQGIWMPDIYVDNLVEQTVDGMESLTQIYPDGSVWRSEQVLLTTKAKFVLTKLPYEEHTAEIIVASYSQDITQIRVIAKGGTVGEEVSGVGINAAPMSSAIWDFEDGAVEGFQTPGKVMVSGGWDYLTLSWDYSRQPRYFVSQVILPCVLFLFISYTQFWVSAAAVPARAALAVLPVLIMRTLSNSIYSSIPQGSQFMWLDVFVQVSTFLCVAAALHFGFVQAFRIGEAKQAAKLSGLVKSRPIAEKLIGIAKREKLPLQTLLTKFAPVEKALDHQASKDLKAALDAEAEAMDEEDGDKAGPKDNANAVQATPTSSSLANLRLSVRSEESVKDGVLEADLLFIRYARQVFRRYDKDESNSISPKEIRGCLTFFNVYMSLGQAVKVVAMFLRDSGHPSHLDENKNVLRFSQFTELLMQIDRYSLQLGHHRSIKAFFQSIPPSERCDVSARWVFPVLIGLQFLVMYVMLAAM